MKNVATSFVTNAISVRIIACNIHVQIDLFFEKVTASNQTFPFRLAIEMSVDEAEAIPGRTRP